MSAAVVWHRTRAGHYTTVVNGVSIEVEYAETAYGDAGWFSWVRSERSDAPVPTKREAQRRALLRLPDCTK